MSMNMVDRLLRQLEARGLSIQPGADENTLLLCGPTAEKTADVIAAVKALKPDLLQRFGRPVALPSGDAEAKPTEPP